MVYPSKDVMIAKILREMQASYEAEGETGDFDDARRYYRNDAPMSEIEADYDDWVNSKDISLDR